MKERVRLAAIRNKFGGGSYGVSRLRSVRAKQVGLLSVHVSRRRKSKEIEKRKKEMERLERLGPGRWGRGRDKKAKMTKSQVRKMARCTRSSVTGATS